MADESEPNLETLVRAFVETWLEPTDNIQYDKKPDVSEASARLGLGWWTGLVKHCQAILVLVDAGLDYESFPIMRTALEETSAIVWLASHGDNAGDILNQHHEKNLDRITTAAQNAEWTVDDRQTRGREANDASELNEVKAPEGYASFKDITTRIRESLGLGAACVYSILCTYTHPSSVSASTYRADDGDRLSETAFTREVNPALGMDAFDNLGRLIANGTDALTTLVSVPTDLVERIDPIRKHFESTTNLEK